MRLDVRIRVAKPLELMSILCNAKTKLKLYNPIAKRQIISRNYDTVIARFVDHDAF